MDSEYQAEGPNTEEEKKVHKEIYKSVWEGVNSRSSSEIARCVMLAAALEPLSDKGGCTTRNTNISRHLKLEYFITGGINIGQVFRELAKECLGVYVSPRSVGIVSPPIKMYKHCFNAQRDSLKNRNGGRINQGIIELLVPIVAAQCLYDRKCSFSVEFLLRKAVHVLKNTTHYDVRELMNMKKLAFMMSCYFDRKVPEYPYTDNVYDYYCRDLQASVNPTSIAHNREFVDSFPTVKKIYDGIMSSEQRSFLGKVEEAFKHSLTMHDPAVGRGFLADCTAAAIYLCLSQNPGIQIIV